MKLRTKVPVSYNKNGTIKEQATSIVEMTLGSAAYGQDFKSLGVNYTYMSMTVAATEEIPAIPAEEITQGAFHLNEEEINSLFAAIKTKLPAFVNEVQYTQSKFFEGAKYQMAQTFGILVTDIEIIE